MDTKKLKLRDAKAYEDWKSKQIDPNDAMATGYGLAPFDRAERWAALMEARMSAEPDTPFEVIAEETERQAGQDAEAEGARDAGLTGFQFGCVVSILSRCWEHGEQLRIWWNRHIQIRDEGDRANEKPGAVLNPALMSVR